MIENIRERLVVLAVKTLVSQLSRDEGFYQSWKANIAMAFKDCYSNATDKDDIHKIANNAADNFLSLLTDKLIIRRGLKP